MRTAAASQHTRPVDECWKTHMSIPEQPMSIPTGTWRVDARGVSAALVLQLRR